VIARALVGLAAVASGCGKSEEAAPPPPAADASPRLVPLARVPAAQLVAGGGRVALVTPDGWLALTRAGLGPDVELSRQLAALRDEHGELEVFLGRHPIVVAGEDHHEDHVRLGPSPSRVAIDGHLVRVAALPGGPELWQIEDRLVARLAVIAGEPAGSELALLPAHDNAGPAFAAPSPVSAKRCAAPAIVDLAAAADAIHALLVECHPDAPVRIVTYRFGERGVPITEIVTLPSPATLGFSPTHVTTTREVVGAADGRLWRAGRGAPRAVREGVTLVLEAVAADDGAVWTLATSADGTRRLSREAAIVALRDPTGALVTPVALAHDAERGLTVLAGDWLFVER
jgi:hypothetical protein